MVLCSYQKKWVTKSIAVGQLLSTTTGTTACVCVCVCVDIVDAAINQVDEMKTVT